jgi:hypothetical protein
MYIYIHVCIIYTLTFQNFYQVLLGNALLDEVEEKGKEIKVGKEVGGGSSLPLSPLSSRKKAWDWWERCETSLIKKESVGLMRDVREEWKTG